MKDEEWAAMEKKANEAWATIEKRDRLTAIFERGRGGVTLVVDDDDFLALFESETTVEDVQEINAALSARTIIVEVRAERSGMLLPLRTICTGCGEVAEYRMNWCKRCRLGP